MAKKKQPGKDQKKQPAKSAGKGASGKPQPQAAKAAAQKQQPPQPQVQAPKREPGPPVFTPVNIAILAAGLALLAVGAYHFYRIQYGHTHTNARIYFQGFALFAGGILVPCLGITPLRQVLFPKFPRSESPNKDSAAGEHTK